MKLGIIFSIFMFMSPSVFANSQPLDAAILACENRVQELDRYIQTIKPTHTQYIHELTSDLSYWIDRCAVLVENKIEYKQQRQVLKLTNKSLFYVFD